MRSWISSRFVTTAIIVSIFLQTNVVGQLDNAAVAAAAAGLSHQMSAQEWLGPLSAIALSPFFGLACLSGAASYGPDWLQSRSSLFGEASPLNNPWLFWVMLSLTVATSLPRFTKVSKPFVLAVEKLEMYSAVIILISMKFMSGTGVQVDHGTSQVEQAVMTAGFANIPLDVLLSLAAALNIIVVNTIKLAIEILVWLIPFPAVDAALELANKSLSALLLALYAYSPMLATGLNLFILLLCCTVFFRVQRRLAYMKELILKPLLGRLFGMQVDDTQYIGFLVQPWNGLPAKSALRITHQGKGEGVQLQYRGWSKNRDFSGTVVRSLDKEGLVNDQMSVHIGGVDVPLDVRKGLRAGSRCVTT